MVRISSFIFTALISLQALSQPVIFDDTRVKTTKSTININGGARIISQSGDPTAVAVDAPKGSLLLDTNGGKIYIKTDAGSSTNWVLSHLADSQVTTAKINNLAVTTGKINDAAVTTAKIEDLAITQAKLAARATGTTVAAGGFAVSASSGAYTQTSTSTTDVTNLSVTITTTGRPVFMGLVSDGSGFACVVGTSISSATSFINSNFYFFRDSSELTRASVGVSAVSGDGFPAESFIPCGALYHFEAVAAGTYTYKLRASGPNAATTTLSVLRAKLVVFEL